MAHFFSFTLCSSELLVCLSHWEENYFRFPTIVSVAQLIQTMQGCNLDLIDYQLLEKQAKHFFEDGCFSWLVLSASHLQTALGIVGRAYFLRMVFDP